MPARGRPPKKSAAAGSSGSGGNASYKAKSGGGSKKANGGGNGSASGSGGGVTHRARDKTRGQGARLYNDPFNDERQLEAQLKRLGLYAANTLGDGSCLFRSLSDQLHGTPNHHLTIRHEVCNFLLEHKDEFIAFVDDSNYSSQEKAFAYHVAEMRNSATYGTQLEIVAFARMNKRKIKVIQAELIYVIGYEDESPKAREEREAKEKLMISGHNRRDSKGKMKEVQEDLPDLYIVYHNWEHYSSARNIAGPHSGLPCIVEATPPSKTSREASTSESSKLPATSASDAALSSNEPTQEESLILSSLRYPHRHSISEIRKLIADSDGSWEIALESLLENEIDETESEDFDHQHSHSHSHSPPPASSANTSTIDSPTSTTIPLSPPAIGITVATPGLSHSQLPSPHHSHHHHHHHHSLIHPRSSSPSASSSATSATNGSQSTTATQLSDLIESERDRKISNTSNASRKTKRSSATVASTSSSHSPNMTSATIGGLTTAHLMMGNHHQQQHSGSSSKVRSRAASPDAEFEAAESPRQRFRLSTSTSDSNTNDGASTPAGGSSVDSADGESVFADNASSATNTNANPTPPPPASRDGTPNIISPVKSSRFPKRRVALSASAAGREPTRRQRKQ